MFNIGSDACDVFKAHVSWMPACCSHHMCGFTHPPAWTPCAHAAVTWLYATSWLASQPTAADHVLSGCILIGQQLTELHMCSVAAYLLHAVCSYWTPSNIIATLKLFCGLTSVLLLPNIFWYLLVSSGIFWQISHVIWVLILYQISIPDLQRFVAFMDLLYADETSNSRQTWFSDFIRILRTFFSDFLHCCVESFATIFGWSHCFMSHVS